MKTHYVAAIINGREVPSSALRAGTSQECIAAAKRLNAYHSGHPALKYGVFPCKGPAQAESTETKPSKTMKTELQKKLATVAPYILIQTLWSLDPDLYDIRKDCDCMDDENPEDWAAWQSEVRATAVIAGEKASSSDYLGGTWEKAGDLPSESNPTISGYEPDMTRTALEGLANLVSGDALLTSQVSAALALL